MWKPITNIEELKTGDRVCYKLRSCNETFGTDSPPRILGEKVVFGGKTDFVVIADGHPLSYRLFEGQDRCDFMVWVDDVEKKESTASRKTESTPIHQGFIWDGVSYKDGEIDGKTIDVLKGELESLKKQSDLIRQKMRRYATLQKRGLK